MTNGEKIQAILDIDTDCTEVYGKNGIMTFSVPQDWWHAEYKEPSSSGKPNKSEIPTGSTTKDDLGVDCISREQAIRELKESAEHHANDSREEALLHRDRDIIRALPPVPIRPKGHWIMTNDYLTTAYGSVDYVKCSCCGEDSLEEGNYCPNCGSYNGGVRAI